jgi:hypothetical protein
MQDLQYKMIMALNAADIGSPICEQAAQICAEIAEQHCSELHITTIAPVIGPGRGERSGPVATTVTGDQNLADQVERR